ncbi:SDR family oxidoreductase [Brevibacillus sp. TJ4]|uniref:SDR family oxidoreductase n=1 Tax=Brevibacillus sp. TJ4 TaxID=3234853 RepID=UPI0037D5BD03
MIDRPIALVTGASSGFGLHASLALVKSGYYVIASMRNLQKREELDKLANAHMVDQYIEIMQMDVTNPADIARTVSSVVARHKRIDLLVNNAGYASGGFVEEVAAEDWRSLFEANVFGLIEVTRAVLPTMRSQRSGHILNMSSISGRIGFPGLAPYAASKHAVEGFSESLRLEMLPYGVHVVLIEPGSYRTAIWDKGLTQFQERSASPYAAQNNWLRARVESIREKAPAPDEVIEAIVHAATVARPRLRYPVGRGVKWTIAAKNLLPWKWIEALVTRQMKS